MEPADLTIARVSARLLGLAPRRHLLASGLSVRQVDRRVASSRLLTVHDGIYRVPAVRPTYEQAVLAACLATGGVASHGCAARLYRLRGFDRHPTVEISVEGSRAPRLHGVHTHKARGIERATIGVIPIAMPAEVLLQLAATEQARAERAVNDVLARKMASLPALVRFLQRRTGRGREGVVVLRHLVAEQVRAGAPTESWLEDRLLAFIRDLGLPEPVRQLWVRLPGRRVRLDLAWPEWRFDTEADGRLFHTSPSDRRQDAVRDAALEKVGWAVERISWLQLEEEPDGVAARLRGRFETPGSNQLAA